MPKFDLTITLTALIALCAIITPSITTIINNRHQLKMKKLDLNLKAQKELIFYKRSIYENYLKYTMRCIHHGTAEAMHLYDDSYALAIIYFPSDLADKVININQAVVTKHGLEQLSVFNDVAKNIREILKTM